MNMDTNILFHLTLGIIIMRKVNEPRYQRLDSQSCFWKIFEQCVVERQTNIEMNKSRSAPKSLRANALELTICCLGLQTSYVLWGVLQERMMTRLLVYPFGWIKRNICLLI